VIKLSLKAIYRILFLYGESWMWKKSVKRCEYFIEVEWHKDIEGQYDEGVGEVLQYFSRLFL
jgi:hypothetical protein